MEPPRQQGHGGFGGGTTPPQPGWYSGYGNELDHEQALHYHQQQQQLHFQWVDQQRAMLGEREAVLRLQQKRMEMQQTKTAQDEQMQMEEQERERPQPTLRLAAVNTETTHRRTLRLTCPGNKKIIAEGMIEVQSKTEMEVAEVEPCEIEVVPILEGSRAGPFMMILDTPQYDHWLSQGQMEVEADDGSEVTFRIVPCDFVGRPLRHDTDLNTKLERLAQAREERKSRSIKFYTKWPIEITSMIDFRSNFEQYKTELQDEMKEYISAACPELVDVGFSTVTDPHTMKEKPATVVHVSRRSDQSANFSDHKLERIKIVPLEGSARGVVILRMDTGSREKTGRKFCCNRLEAECEGKDGRFCNWTDQTRGGAYKGIKRTREDDPEFGEAIGQLKQAAREDWHDRYLESSTLAQQKADKRVAAAHLKKVGPTCGDGVPAGHRCRFFEMGRCVHLGPADNMKVCVSQGGHKGMLSMRVYCGCSTKRQGKKWTCSFEPGQSPYAYCMSAVSEES